MAFNKAKALQEAEKLVGQGKTSLAIREYLQIIEKDPSDLILRNTVGDLYVREKNIPEALKHFNTLADHYTREGFTVKAIAIYKKISKADPNAVEPLLKLGELYLIQGLGREAREQYAQAADVFLKKNRSDKALEVFRKIVHIDPENLRHRTRLAEFCEQLGQKADAMQAYLEMARIALRRGEPSAAEVALKKAASLDPKNSQVHLLMARLALVAQRPEGVEKIIEAAPELKGQPAALELLLEAYLATHNLEAAEKLVLDVYRANPADFAPLSSFAALCVEKGDLDAALKPMTEVAEGLIAQKNTGPLMDTLRQIWGKSPNHIPTLELLYKVCERTADEFTLPEVLEALGHAYVQSGQLEKAETIYGTMVKREPENEHYRGLLKQVLQKQGKEYVAPSPEGLLSGEIALTPEVETLRSDVPAAPSVDAEQAAVVKEALENSDLFARYGLVDKAVAELEKVLSFYPEQVDIYERILEIWQRTQPARAGEAAQELARIFARRGDHASARRYEEMARRYAAPSAGVAEPGKLRAPEFDLSTEIPLDAEPPAGVAREPAQPPPGEVPSDQALPPLERGGEPPRATGTEDFSLSDEFTGSSAPTQSSAAEREVFPFNYEGARAEIDFYVEQGFEKEAYRAIEALEEEFPENLQVAELRDRVEDRFGGGRRPRKAPRPAPMEEGSWAAPSKGAVKERKLAPSAPEPIAAWPGTEVAPPRPLRDLEGVPVEGSPSMAKPSAAGPEMLNTLANDVASGLGAVETVLPPPSSQAEAQSPPAKGVGTGADSATPLSSLLEELGEPAKAQTAQDDPETHYNLGVAFREMGLLDEAIGEFQKVAKGTQKDKFPPHFLQACTLLASSFMDKKMPAIATKWYLRALEMPDLDEEARLALQYDLGMAYEQAGDTRTALEKFTEVYSQNIDYRNVAEKIRLLQQKVS